MSSRKPTSNIDERESDFVRLLQSVLANDVPVEELLEHEIFRNRLRLITLAHARTTQDAEELANDVRLKVWQNLRDFKPDYGQPYGSFFAWLRVVTRNAFLNTLGRREVEYDPLEDLDIADTQRDIESSVLYREVLAEFEKSINALPQRQRLAVAYYLQGYTFRETSERMLQAGFRSSHVRFIRKWIKDGLITAFFPKPGQIPNVRSSNVRVTKVRATRAKREFYTVLEQAINSGTVVAVTSEGTYITPRTPLLRHRTSKTAQPNSRPGWQSANDLLKNMQSPESKQGIQAAFDASPEALGEAAVEDANERRKVPVGTLTTFLMAASTANVVERVMNLSEDAA